MRKAHPKVHLRGKISHGGTRVCPCGKLTPRGASKVYLRGKRSHGGTSQGAPARGKFLGEPVRKAHPWGNKQGVSAREKFPWGNQPKCTCTGKVPMGELGSTCAENSPLRNTRCARAESSPLGERAESSPLGEQARGICTGKFLLVSDSSCSRAAVNRGEVMWSFSFLMLQGGG